MKTILTFILLSFSWALIAASDKSSELTISTVIQKQIRPSYPFPALLSTGPYIWYENTQKKPIKGHTFRISTFNEDYSYKIFIEKVQFGNDGCCLEIVDYRQLLINEITMNKLFPNNSNSHRFKLIRWIQPELFEFEAYGGTYQLSNISRSQPTIEEVNQRN